MEEQGWQDAAVTVNWPYIAGLDDKRKGYLSTDRIFKPLIVMDSLTKFVVIGQPGLKLRNFNETEWEHMHTIEEGFTRINFYKKP